MCEMYFNRAFIPANIRGGVGNNGDNIASLLSRVKITRILYSSLEYFPHIREFRMFLIVIRHEKGNFTVLCSILLDSNFTSPIRIILFRQLNFELKFHEHS